MLFSCFATQSAIASQYLIALALDRSYPQLKLTLETVFMAVNGDLTGAVKSFVSQQASLPQIPGAVSLRLQLDSSIF